MSTYIPLILSNIVASVFAILEGWSLSYLLWAYWFQSVIIGIFHFFTILGLKQFQTTDLKFNGRLLKPDIAAKRSVAFFFLFHYGFFHFVYAVFLFILPSMLSKTEQHAFVSFFFGSGKWLFFLSVASFFLSSLIDFIRFRHCMKKDVQLGTMLFFPYARILPMHLCIILAFFIGSTKVPLPISITPQTLFYLFILLKTGADLLMQYIENNKLRDL